MNRTVFAIALVAVVVALGVIEVLSTSNPYTYSLSCRSQRTAVTEVLTVNMTDLTTISIVYWTQLGVVSNYTTTTNSSASAGLVISMTSTEGTTTGAVMDYVGITCTYTK